MKIISKVINSIFNPIANLFGVKLPEAISKVCNKKPVIIFIVSVGITVCIILYAYHKVIFNV